MKSGDHAVRPAGGQGLLVGGVLAVAAAAFWLWMWTAHGPMKTRDSAGYLALAGALLEGHAGVAERPDRTPGYPLLLLACRALSALGGWDWLAVVVVCSSRNRCMLFNRPEGPLFTSIGYILPSLTIT
jgi:hypothetical protein